jgi:hypothetical protein
MRAALVLAALCLAGPGLAQESHGSFNVQALNGVRVWRSNPATVSARPAAPLPIAPQPVTIVINQAPVVDDDDAFIAGSFGSPFFHSRPFVRGRPFFHSRPSFHARPFFPSGRIGHHGRPMSVQRFRGRF